MVRACPEHSGSSITVQTGGFKNFSQWYPVICFSSLLDHLIILNLHVTPVISSIPLSFPLLLDHLGCIIESACWSKGRRERFKIILKKTLRWEHVKSYFIFHNMSTTLNQHFLYCASIFCFWDVKLRTGTEVKLFILVIVLFPFESVMYNEVLWLLNSCHWFCLRLNLSTYWEHAVEALQGEGWDISNQNQDISISAENHV